MKASSALRILATGAVIALGDVRAAEYFGPTPYLSAADTPAAFGPGTMRIEDCEDGAIDPRLTFVDTVTLIGPGGNTDSVDADDGVIDGSGSNGRSLFRGTPSITVVFSAPLPTAAGLVWTDGGSSASVRFEALGADGGSLGVHGPFTLGDGGNMGGTAEDRFFGARDAGGISRLRIWHTTGGIEIDHIQFSLPDALFDDGFDGLP